MAFVLRLIVGFVLMLGAHQQAAADEDVRLIVSPDSIASADKPDQLLKLGDAFSEKSIKSRLPSFTPEYWTECESACFFVSNEDVGFLVYGKEGGKVTGFASFNPKTRDHLGNKVGVPLRDALKSETASCWSDNGLFCTTSIPGFLYSADQPDDCGWDEIANTSEGKEMTVPACAILGGFKVVPVKKH
jgi:hypothetical protein